MVLRGAAGNLRNLLWFGPHRDTLVAVLCRRYVRVGGVLPLTKRKGRHAVILAVPVFLHSSIFRKRDSCQSLLFN